MQRRHWGNVAWLDIMLQRWLTPVIMLAYRHTVTEHDIPALPPAESAAGVANDFNREWQREIERAVRLRQPPSAFRAVVKSNLRPFATIAVYEAIFYATTFASPYLVDALTSFFERAGRGEPTDASEGLLYAMGLALVAQAAAAMVVYKFFYCTTFGQRMRSMVMMTVFDKSLAIAPSAALETTTGEVMNLMANDAQKLPGAALFAHLPWISPTVILICMVLLWAKIGPSALVAMALMAMLLPMQLLVARWVGKNRRATLVFTDARVKQVNEMLQGVRVIKLYAWEGAVRRTLAAIREKELRFIRNGLLYRMLNLVMLFVWPALVTYLTTVAYAHIGDGELQSNTIFFILSFLNVARFPITLLPYVMQSLVESLVATKRVATYLTRAELPQRPLLPAPAHAITPAPQSAAAAAAAASPAATPSKRGGAAAHSAPAAGVMSAPSQATLSKSLSLVPPYAARFAVAMRHAAFTWSREPLSSDAPPVLADVSLALLPGSLTAVVGPVGAGKSSLISAILGEMHLYASGDWARAAGAVPSGLTEQERALWQLAARGEARAPDAAPAVPTQRQRPEAGALAPIKSSGHGAGAGSAAEGEEPFMLSPDTGLPLPASFLELPAPAYSTAMPPPPPLAAGPDGVLLAERPAAGDLDCSDPRAALQLVCLRGRVGYLAQDPWILHATVRDNITLGLPYSRARFDAVVAAAALAPDFAILQHGADTVIGEQGVNLSGGQKARVAMARLLYRADLLDVVLLDDPFSAVDMGVGKHMWEQCVLGVLRNKTRLICLNSHLHFLRQVDAIAVLDAAAGRGASAPASPAHHSQDHSPGHSHGNVHVHDIDLDLSVDSSAARSGSSLGAIGAGAGVDVAAGLVSDMTRRPVTTIVAQGTYAELVAADVEFSRFEHHNEGHDPEEPPAMGATDADGEPIAVPAPDDAAAAHEIVAIEPESEAETDGTDGAGGKEAEGFSPSPEKARRDSVGTARERVRAARAEKRGHHALHYGAAAAAQQQHGKANAAPAGGARKAKIGEEKVMQGDVGLNAYLTYFHGGATFQGMVLKLSVMTVLALLAQVTRMLVDYWVIEWANDSPEGPLSAHTLSWWEGTSGIIITSCFAALFMRTFSFVYTNISASRSLHDSNFDRVLHAPMGWFDVTPLGQIVNRFSKDMDDVDILVPDNLVTVAQQSLMLVGIVVLACISTPVFLVPFTGIAVLMAYAVVVFRRSLTQLKRCESKSFSPVYASFSSATKGAMTIRAMALVQQFTATHEALLDVNTKVCYIFNLIQRWLSFRLDSLSCVYIFVVGALCVLLRGSINPRVAGLAIVYAYQLTGLLQWTVRSALTLQAAFTSVERIEQYAHIPQEPEYRTTPDARIAVRRAAAAAGVDLSSFPIEVSNGTARVAAHSVTVAAHSAPSSPSRAYARFDGDDGGAASGVALTAATIEDAPTPMYGWPWRGAMRFTRVTMRYRPDLPIVIHDLSFALPPGKKVGIIGRTGAGKSSLLLILFRMVELSAGRVEIDGVDISTLGLGDLRARMSIIPQQPTLFSGTVRYNLDPFGHHSDAELLTALRRVQMLEVVEAMPGVLQAPVSEFGGNFSQGQRQLLCIARALLRNNKIIVLDEATAAVDPATDAAIQSTIRECFADCTILTIAHRLETIVDYDYVLVLGPVQADSAETAHSARVNALKDGLVEPPGTAPRAHETTGGAETSDPLSSRREFDAPYRLLCNPESALYRMAAEGGPQVLAALTAKAKAAYDAM